MSRAGANTTVFIPHPEGGPPRVCLARSEKHGLGIFATTDISPQQTVLVEHAPLVSMGWRADETPGGDTPPSSCFFHALCVPTEGATAGINPLLAINGEKWAVQPPRPNPSTLVDMQIVAPLDENWDGFPGGFADLFQSAVGPRMQLLAGEGLAEKIKKNVWAFPVAKVLGWGLLLVSSIL